MDTTINREVLCREQFFPISQGTASTTHQSAVRFVPALLVLADLCSGALALFGTICVLPENALHLHFLLIAPVIAIFTLYLIGGYDRRTDFLALGYVSEYLIAILSATAVAMLLAYVFSTYNLTVKPSRAFIPMLFFLFAIPSLYFRRSVGLYMQRYQAAETLLVLGANADARRFYREYMESGMKWNLEFVDPEDGAGTSRIDGVDSPFVKTDARAMLDRMGDRCAAVLLACKTIQLSPPVLQSLIGLHCSNVPVLTLQTFREQHWRRVHAEAVGPEWLFNTEFLLAHGSVYSYLKRLADIVVSAMALILLFPVLLLIAFLVGVESRGSSIFRQNRVGRDGRVFVMFKFRTMCENSGDIYTQEKDQRVTRCGRWLRRMRLDELPQLWNVLIGDMSLIGPRAEWVKCADIYEREIPNYHLRHLVTPGITGWAQVRFRYGQSKEDALQKFEYDLYYIRHFSLELDVTIVLKTIYTILGGKGR